MVEETHLRKLQKKVFALCNNAGLSRMDRLTLAREMFKADIESFNDLSITEMEDLCFGLDTWDSIQKIREANGALLNEAQILIDLEASGYADTEPLEDTKPVKAARETSKIKIESSEASDTEALQSDQEEPTSDPSEDVKAVEVPAEFVSARKRRARMSS